MAKPKANTGIPKPKAESRKQRRDADKKDVSMSTKKRQTTKKISEAVASVPKSRRGILVATYKKRPDQMGWIVKHNLYNYALSAEEATATKDGWNKVKEFWLYSGPKDKRHIYEAEFVGVKSRKEFLAEYPDYPKGKTKHGDFYALFKVAIRYQPTTENFKAVVRAPDFNRTPKVAKAVRAYQAGGELGSLLDYLPDELAPIPHDQLYVCEAAIQLSFWDLPEMKAELKRVSAERIVRQEQKVCAPIAEYSRAAAAQLRDATKKREGHADKSGCSMMAIDVDMETIAAPILERYNRERKPEDTWNYFAEYLEPDTFIVNARGLCLTKESFDRRDVVVCDIAKEIETAANKAAGIEPDDDYAWDCCEQCYWDCDGNEIESPDYVDWNDTPLWKKITDSQWMVCCPY